jgi:hypothetical protein
VPSTQTTCQAKCKVIATKQRQLIATQSHVIVTEHKDKAQSYSAKTTLQHYVTQSHDNDKTLVVQLLRSATVNVTCQPKTQLPLLPRHATLMHVQSATCHVNTKLLKTKLKTKTPMLMCHVTVTVPRYR